MNATASRPSRKRDLTSGSLPKNLFRLAAPLAAGTAMHALYSIVDAFWLGGLGKEALGAPGVSMPLIFIVIAFAIGFGQGGSALVAQYTGAGRHREADVAAAQTILLLTAVAVAMAAPMMIFAPHLFALARVPRTVAVLASGYVRIFFLGIPMAAFTIACAAVWRALGDTMTMVIVGVVSNVINLLLDPLLIHGWRLIPSMGVNGAALASFISSAMAAAACVVLLRRGRAGLRLALADMKPARPVLREIARIGLPAAVSMSSNSFGFAVFHVMVNSLGANVIGAFTIGFRLTHFFAIPARAMAMAAAPVVGQALGAGKVALARRAVRMSVVLVAAGMFVPYALLMWQGELVARAFVDDAAVIAEAGRFFLVVPASSYCFGVLMVLMAAFYGSGHTRPIMFLSVLRQWGVRLPAAWLLGFIAGWGSMGVYLGLVIGNVSCACIALWLFRAGGWESAVVPVAASTSEQHDEEPRNEA